jgi:hypothetical protein
VSENTFLQKSCKKESSVCDGVCEMKKLLAIAVLLAGLMSAQAKLGETLPQLSSRFGTPTKYDANLVHFRVQRGAVSVFMQGGVSKIEAYYTKDVPLVSGEPPNDIVRGILEVESPYDKWQEIKWLPYYDYAMINKSGRLVAGLKWTGKGAPGMWSVDVGYSADMRSWAQGMATSEQSVPTPPPTIAPPPQYYPTPQQRSPNDCALIAAEAYAKLKPVTHWCQIMGVHVETTKETFGHAMVFFKIDASGHVMVYDARGTQELNTTSEDPQVLARAITYSMWTLTGSYPQGIVLRPLTYDQAQTYQPAAIKTTIASTPAPKQTNKQLNDFAETVGLVMFVIIFKAFIGGGIGYAIGWSKNRPWDGFWWGTCIGVIGWIITAGLSKKEVLNPT